LRKYARQVEADVGLRPDLPTSEEREEIKALRKEVYELRRANEILKAASVLSRPARCRRNELSRLIDEHRGRFGFEPICRSLGVSASVCYSTSGLGTPCESVAAFPTLPSPATVRPLKPAGHGNRLLSTRTQSRQDSERPRPIHRGSTVVYTKLLVGALGPALGRSS
jgi:hypothetical protein